MDSTGLKARRSHARSPLRTPRDETSGTQATEQPIVFKLQLRPLEDNETFKPSVQLVAREYATRYLESVGVRPSKAAMELVHRNAPLTDSHIKTTLRAKGHVEDTIKINVPPVVHHYRPPMVINPAAVLQLGIGNSVLGAEGSPEAEADDGSSSPTSAARGAKARPGSRSGGDAGRAPGGAEFLDMASRYLHPFKLDLSLARQNLSALYSVTRLKNMGAVNVEAATAPGRASGGGLGEDGRDPAGVRTSTSGRSVTGQGGSGSGGVSGGATREARVSGVSLRSLAGDGSRRSGSWPRSGSGRGHPDGGGGSGLIDEVTRLEVQEELVQPLLVTPEVVLTLQGQLEAALMEWHRNQAPEALKGRLTPEEFRATQEELSSEGTVKLLITLVNFLHEELVRGHPSFPAHLQLMDQRQPSRDGVRSSQGRVRDSMLGDRTSGFRTSTCDGGGGGGGSTNRSHASNSVRGVGGQQLPSSLSTQQMTSLQKYDLGYQAYVRQKLEQRHANVSSANQQERGPGLGGASTSGPAAAGEQPQGRGLASAGGDRSHAPSRQQHRPHRQGHGGLATAAEPQRVSFAAAAHYPSLPSSPQPPESRPESPTLRGSSTALLGPLNLPGARSRPSSQQVSASPNRGSAASPVPSTSGGPAVDFALEDSPIPGLPPRVGRALRHSPSFALASAASTARSIHASLDADDVAALQRERLFALHVAFASRFKALRQRRSGMFFTLPILLLSMRLCVNLLFSTMYPLWTQLPEGVQVLEDMDAALCGLFDPHGYIERALSVLQSTPTAIEAVMRHPQRRGNERQHFNDTSALMQATLPGPKSAGARRLMMASTNQPQGRALLRTQLTNGQRAALFQQGLQLMAQPDPVLSQVGEPHPPGRPTTFPIPL